MWNFKHYEKEIQMRQMVADPLYRLLQNANSTPVVNTENISVWARVYNKSEEP